MKELTRRDFFKWSALGGAIGLADVFKPFDLLKAAENAPFKEGAENPFDGGRNQRGFKDRPVL